ncbi:hypothetical protein PoB_006349900 [Plakobranchus ocellatus]|uniref:Uncharacterized protein n=1 Tax=Plakobranchus ocellatus TaxID=259542 RepID=A0AAV4CYS5_9GAST|nr:hypothetical protein PoB_006349900 [Plakobranchus ocellatus]
MEGGIGRPGRPGFGQDLGLKGNWKYRDRGARGGEPNHQFPQVNVVCSPRLVRTVTTYIRACLFLTELVRDTRSRHDPGAARIEGKGKR